MRPPHYAGENLFGAVAVDGGVDASMRPPHYAGENAVPASPPSAVGTLQ